MWPVAQVAQLRGPSKGVSGCSTAPCSIFFLVGNEEPGFSYTRFQRSYTIFENRASSFFEPTSAPGNPSDCSQRTLAWERLDLLVVPVTARWGLSCVCDCGLIVNLSTVVPRSKSHSHSLTRAAKCPTSIAFGPWKPRGLIRDPPYGNSPKPKPRPLTVSVTEGCRELGARGWIISLRTSH
jgi:hypothetical protein